MDQDNDFFNLLTGAFSKQEQTNQELDFWLQAPVINVGPSLDTALSSMTQVAEENYTPSSSSKSKSPRVIPPPTREPIKDAQDKRKRNTEASARFRLKKKQEQLTLKQENDVLKLRVVELESKLKEKELEIEWLRDLVRKT
jgi:hypothetical protein